MMKLTEWLFKFYVKSALTIAISLVLLLTVLPVLSNLSTWGLMVCAFLVITLITLFLFRSHWVFEVRIRMISENFEEYLTLEGPDRMFAKFWIWDVRRFIQTPSMISNAYA